MLAEHDGARAILAPVKERKEVRRKRTKDNHESRWVGKVDKLPDFLIRVTIRSHRLCPYFINHQGKIQIDLAETHLQNEYVYFSIDSYRRVHQFETAFQSY